MLLPMLLAYAAASLLHHVHNAQFLEHYPNMPAWISAGLIYAAWIASTAIGLTGYGLLRRGYRLAGSILLAIYGAYGLDALVHYAVAPIATHTPMMHVSIGLEVAAALALLATLALSLRAK